MVDQKKEEKKAETAEMQLMPTMPNVYALVDVKDIIEHLKTAVTDNWAYKITFNKGSQDEKVVKGLSIVGAVETAAILAKLSRGQHVIRPIEIKSLTETAEAWHASVLVGVYVVGLIDGKQKELLLNTYVGFHAQPKLGVRKDRSTWVIAVPDKLAISKAQRQGIEHLIPDKWKQRIIEVAEKGGKIHDESGESERTGSEAAKKNDKATEAQIGGINKRLGNKHIDGPTREHYENALGLGMDKWQASRAIKSLDQIIKAGEEKEKKEEKPGGKGLFSGSG